MAKADNYQALQARLDQVLARLENPAIDVDAAVAAHKEGLALVKQLRAHLTEAETAISKLQADFGG